MRELRELIEAVNTLLAEVSWHDMGESRVERIRKALATVEAQGTAGWQPIETAPKDGTEVLATGFDFGIGQSRHVMVAAYEGWLWTDTHNHEAPYLTHWMPLPEPPKEV